MACGTTAHQEDGGMAWMREEGDDPGWADLGWSAVGSSVESLELGPALVERKRKMKQAE
jgi:hypothetical protein